MTAWILLQSHMKEKNMDGVLVRSTDVYLNEYVPEAESIRVFITGFNGSVGDAIILQNEAHLFVDGRYTLQARLQCPDFMIHEVPLGKSIESFWLSFIEKNIKGLLEVDTKTLPKKLFDQLKAISSVDLSCPKKTLAESLHNQKTPFIKKPLIHLNQPQKDFKAILNGLSIDGFFVSLLDDIAWLTHLRGEDFPYQATFKAQAVLTKEGVWLEREATQWPVLFQKCKGLHIGYDPDFTTQAVVEGLQEAGAILVETKNPITPLKAIKSKQELQIQKTAFQKADKAIFDVIQWVKKSVKQGDRISEYDVSVKMREAFLEKGATDCSFASICAFGKHGAIVHYSHPDSLTYLEPGELFLLDVGALFEGYATDLTRTFFLEGQGKAPTQKQKNWFTTTLKASIAGLTAQFPKGTTGIQLDALVRHIFWKQGYDYPHGTGHGIGIQVHEAPPRISKSGAWPLEVGHVFSIEPGIYIENEGGVRLENLATVMEHPEKKDWLCVVPLTFCPLDESLIEWGLLDSFETQFVTHYQRQARE